VSSRWNFSVSSRATYLDLSQSSLLAPNEFRLRVVGGYTSSVALAVPK